MFLACTGWLKGVQARCKKKCESRDEGFKDGSRVGEEWVCWMLTRRRALALGVTAIVGWLWAGAAMRVWPTQNGAKPSDPGSMIDGRHVALGKAYLQRHPDEALQSRLARLVPADPVLRSRQVQADFAAGQVVTLGGWLLSRTECRYCALYALTSLERG